MLKDIRLHLEMDEELQSELERDSSEYIVDNHRLNVGAFKRYIPSLTEYARNVTTNNIAIFVNKFGGYNIVDYGTGRTIYGLHPLEEIQTQVQRFTERAPYIALNCSDDEQINIAGGSLEQLSTYQKYKSYTALPNDVDALVILGIGLGHHIEYLIENNNIKHLIIYEPERQFFQCSVLVMKWHKLLKKAEEKGTTIYLQLEKDGRDIVENIKELSEYNSVDGIYFYKHYNHVVFDAVDFELKNKSWPYLIKHGIDLSQRKDFESFFPTWTGSVDLEHAHPVTTDDERFQNNLAAFERYFPDIHKEFIEYSPKHWVPVKLPNGEINLLEKRNLIPFYGDSPIQDSKLSFEHYNHFPQKDALVLGYNGTKLRKYKHYQFVSKTEKLLEEVAEEIGQLPDVVKSLIMFGVGAGYQLESLLEQKDVEKLFLCEPNRDFFYASLFAIDWSTILSEIDQKQYRIYINIGDDGTHLFRDLLSQFYSIGPYILASTYFYQTYHNANLTASLVQLREQLQIIIAMGEYYDHALYGISHTTEIIQRGYPILLSGAKDKLSYHNKEVPIFLVGNGPSLDKSIDAIKEWQDKAIVVSCGTALMPLYKNGITPDFHAEIEQNRSTFDWICRIGDFEYLKNITLISCNGIHPDTCDLFKDVLIAFKAGESSTVSALNIIGRKSYEELDYAFPTVSNFALNLFTKIGFNQVYLFGIDLGFVDRQKHHSVQSGYYQQNGNEMYNYSEKNNTSLVVPGNFEKTVFTKHEFKVSKEILEQTLTNISIDCFNSSNGARIKGTLPLKADDVLLVNTEDDTREVIGLIKNSVFKPVTDFNNYITRFSKQYQEANLAAELDHLLSLVEGPIDSVEDIDKLIDKQKNTLFDSYRSGSSLLFYLLYGSTNYCNVLLSKCAYIINKDALFDFVDKLLAHWKEFLLEVQASVAALHINFDVSMSFSHKREMAYLKSYNQKTLYLTNVTLPGTFNTLNQRFFPNGNVEIREFSLNTLQNTDFTLYDRIQCAFLVLSQNEVGAIIDMFKTYSVSMPNIFWFGNEAANFDYSGLHHYYGVVLHTEFLCGEAGFQSLLEGKGPFWVKEQIPFSALRYDFPSDYNRVIVPKLQLIESEYTDAILGNYYEKVLSTTTQYAHYLEFYGYIIFADYDDLTANMFDIAGNRGMVFTKDKLHKEALFLCTLTEYQIELYRETVDWGA